MPHRRFEREPRRSCPPCMPLFLALALRLFFCAAPCQAQDAKPKARVGAVDVVVLSTMLTDTKGIGEWGFSALVVADGHRLLFDTGAR
ncbi:MAG TPA: hypothetical protein VGY53_06110, partial [Isosphaeraceae bacterium]|nr:hypothetical protein [Isosphaeraceae bacterium]